MRIGPLRTALVAGAVLLLATPLHAQEPPQPAAQDTTELVFEREVFSYPDYHRRNPFRSLVTGDDAGPLFEDLELLGIVHSDNPALSVALFGVGDPSTGAAGAAEGAFQSYRARRGNVIGNTRVVAIQPTRVIVQVTEFGLTEQRVLDLPRANQGDSR